MGFIGTVIAIVVAILAAQGIRDVTAQQEKDSIVVRGNNGKEITTIPITELEPVQQKPLDFAESFAEKIVSTDTSKPKTPQLTVANPLDREVILYNLSLAPNASKKSDLAIHVRANGRPIIKVKQAALDFVDTLNVPLGDKGVRISRGGKLEFFLWGGGDVELLANGLFGSNFEEVKK